MTCYVYVISCGKSNQAPIKIGVADNPWDRIKTLQTGNHKLLTLRYTLECKDRAHAFRMEKTIHRELSGCNVLGEWYKPRRSTLFKALKKYCEEHDYKAKVDAVIYQDDQQVSKLKKSVKRYKEIIKDNERVIKEGKVKRGVLRDMLHRMGVSKDEVEEKIKSALDISE